MAAHNRLGDLTQAESADGFDSEAIWARVRTWAEQVTC